MKRVYMFQPEYLQGNSAAIPYAAGVLVAYAENIPQIRSVYEFESIVFMREDIQSAAEKIKAPDIAAFSCYIWNFEYNKVLAREIKNRFPGCKIIFGGHHIPAGDSLLIELDYVDFLIHGEGEEVFSLLLRALNSEFGLENVPNISYRTASGAINTQARDMCSENYPSAYLTGVFDSLIKDNPDIQFHMILETSRGCPYSCTYCDWGRLHSRLKFAPLEKVYAEIDWARDNKIGMILMADANFGMFERDVEITEYIVNTHKKHGCFSALQTSYEKGNKPYVFRIASLLHSCGMNKGITLSFQSMSAQVLENIERKNITLESFIEALEKYNKSGISTYSELILGLPGETCDSFANGIDKLLDAGQHTCIYIHNCDLLPCSQMSNPQYTEKFGISASKMPINHPHMDINNEMLIEEYSHIVTCTAQMTKEDWVKMNMLSSAVQCFHFGGVLKLIAVYLHYKKGVAYSIFYSRLCDELLGRDYPCFKIVFEQLTDAANEKSGLVFTDEKLCSFSLSADEYIQLNIFTDINAFYDFIYEFIMSWDSSDEYRALFDFQREAVKRPQRNAFNLTLKYDFVSYFRNIFENGCDTEIRKADTVYKCNPIYYDFSDFSKYVVWYGKKTEDRTYLCEMNTVSDEEGGK